MPRQEPPRPTDAELEILQVLWDRGPCTVRQVQQRLPDRGYTTVLKLLQIMTDKRLVVCDSSQRTHVFRARWAQQQTQRQLVQDLIARAFGGAADALVVQALRARQISTEEVAEVRRILDELEGGAP